MKGNVYFYQGVKKLGNSVGYTVKGKQLFRAYKEKIANPKTAAQTLQRAKFALLVERAQAFRNVVRLGFEYMSNVRKSTAFNAFFHANFPKVVGSTPENVNLQPEDMVIAQGPLTNVIFNDTIDAASAPGVVTVKVDDASIYDPSESDTLVYAVAYNEELNRGIMSAGAQRVVGDIDIHVPMGWVGLEVHVYGFTASADGKQASDSVYIGHTTVS